MNTGMGQRGGRGVLERAKRSRLCQLAQAGGVVHGSLVDMARTCGNPGCRCEKRGQKHVSLYLTVTRQGKPQMIYIPRDWERRVREWVKRHQDIRRILEELCQMHWEKIRTRQER